jgi:hypothetical protein
VAQTYYKTWADALLALGGSNDREKKDDDDPIALIPWEDLGEEGRRAQMQALLTMWQQGVEQLGSMSLTPEQEEYLRTTPWDELTPAWKQVAAAMAQADDRLQRIDAALREAQEKYPDILASLAAETSSTLAAPLAPSSGGAGDLWPSSSLGDLSQYMADYYRSYLHGLELDNARSAADLWAQRAALADLPNQLSYTNWQREAEKRLFERDWAWEEEDRRRAIEAQQRAFQQAAAELALRQRQVAASIANNLGALEQDAWRFAAQNALPAGIGFVPGFEPNSRLAQVLGPSFQGLPTVTLPTPDPRAPYAWALQFARGG